MWRDSFSNLELEYLAESTLIYIIPNFRKDQIHLLSGDYGPFKPNKMIQVPLWLAVNYRKNKKCKIMIPSYLETNFLTTKIEQEKESKGTLTQLPNFFFEIAQILFSQAEEDFFDIKLTRGMVEDLAAMRVEKINQILEGLNEGELTYKLTSFNEKEIEQVRPFLTTVFPMKLNIYAPKSYPIPDNNLFINPSQNENDDEDQ